MGLVSLMTASCAASPEQKAAGTVDGYIESLQSEIGQAKWKHALRQ